MPLIRSRYGWPMTGLALMALLLLQMFLVDMRSFRQMRAVRTDIQQRSVALADAIYRKERLFALVPAANGPVKPVDEVALLGGVVLLNLARAHHLQVEAVQLRGSSLSSGVALRGIAVPVTGSGGQIKKVACVIKSVFTSLADLQAFVREIPGTGGYLAAVRVRQHDAVLLVNFLGT